MKNIFPYKIKIFKIKIFSMINLKIESNSKIIMIKMNGIYTN